MCLGFNSCGLATESCFALNHSALSLPRQMGHNSQKERAEKSKLNTKN